MTCESVASALAIVSHRRLETANRIHEVLSRRWASAARQDGLGGSAKDLTGDERRTQGLGIA